jgi:S-formylglutathione hydrolase FrmB
LALTYPGTFLAVSGLSAALNPMGENDKDPGKDVLELLGDQQVHAEAYAASGVYRRSKEQAAKLPPIYLNCGLEDRYVEEQRTFVKHLTEAGVPETQITAIESPGKHDWAFWRDASAGIIAFHGKHFATVKPAQAPE